MDIVAQVQQKIVELQNIMAQKGKGGETTISSVGEEAPQHKQVTANIEAKAEPIQGGSAMPNPISRGGEPVQDGKLVDLAAIAAMGGPAGNVPPTDFMAMAKAADPYNESGAQSGIVSRAGASESASETNTVINKELKGMPSTKEHAEALKVVEKAVSTKKEASVEDINAIVERVKALRQANREIDQVVRGQEPVARPSARESILARIKARMQARTAKVDGAITDPVKGSEDAAKTPEESVKSIKKGESEMRPVEVMSDGKSRYTVDKGNDIRDKEAKDAISKGDKDMGKAEKEPKEERPVTNKKAALAGKLASMEVLAEDAARKDQNMPTSVKYPVEKSPDQDWEGAASRTEKEIASEHKERESEKGEKSPLKTTLWSDMRKRKQAGVDREILRKQIAAYKSALKDIKGESEDDLRKLEVIEANVAALEKQMEKLSGSTSTWEGLIQEGNVIHANLIKMFAQIDGVITPFLAKAEEVKKVRTAADEKEEGEEHEKKESLDFEAGEKEEKKEEGKKDDKPKSKKKEPKKEVAGDVVDLLESIRDTMKEISEDIDAQLKDSEKKTGIPAPKPGDMKGLPGMDMGAPALPEMGAEPMPGDMGAMDMEMGTEKPMKLSLMDMFPKTAADEQAVVKAILDDPTLTPENKAKTVKNIQSQAGWKAVFTKLGEPEKKEEDKKDEEKKDDEKMVEGSAIVDKKNSYWSVYRGAELVARASVEDLYKDKAEEAFAWASSAEYGKKLLGSILNEGLYTTAEKLGIEGMVRTAKKGKGAPDALDAKSYYKKVYPASYVSELFKTMKKKSELQVNTLTTKVGELESQVEVLKKANAELEENQVLHAKAEKALAMVRTGVDKGVIEAADFNTVVDSVMLMDENAFSTFASTIAKAPTFRKEATIDQKIDMVKKASAERKPVSLEVPIQIGASAGNAFTETRSQLEGLWRRPPVVSQ